MLSTQYTLGQVPEKVTTLEEGEVRTLDWDSYLSIEMIRQHTKTDDVPGVTDKQLRLYRAAAIESAEKYTGLVLTKSKVVTEIIPPPTIRPGRDYAIIRLQNPSSDGIVYLYGNTNHPEMIHITPNTRTVRIRAAYFMSLDLSNCCDPCSKLAEGLRILYRAGFGCPEDIPAGVLLGILQFIAWIIEHPGDEVLSMRNTLSARGGAVIGSNNIALVSGALETWRQFDPEGF